MAARSACWACQSMFSHRWHQHEKAYVARARSTSHATPAERAAAEIREEEQHAREAPEVEVECPSCGALNHRADHMAYFKRLRGRQTLAREMKSSKKPIWERLSKAWVSMIIHGETNTYRNKYAGWACTLLASILYHRDTHIRRFCPVASNHTSSARH